MPLPAVVLPLAWALALASAPPALVARCERGAADACREVGRALLLGEAGRPGAEARLGVANVMLACELGDAPACGDLGALHALGRGVAWDAARATALSRRACQAGVAYACANLGVLLAEEAGGLERGRLGLEVTRRFRTACEAGVAESCLDLAVSLEVGAGSARDPEGAARALRRGCDLGLGLACHRLVLARPADPDTGELLARACAAAIAPACQAAKLPLPPAGAATPSPRLVEDPRSLALGIPGAGGFHPADLAARPAFRAAAGAPTPAPSPAVQALVPEVLRARVGLEGASAEAGPDDAVELLLPSRRLELGQCLDVPRAAPRASARLAVAFLVEADGRTGAVRAAAEPPEPGLEACAAGVAGDWEFPIGDGRSGPFAAVLDVEPLPGGVAPVYPGASGLRPAPRSSACLAAPVLLAGGAATRSVTLKLAVDPSGRAVLVHALTPAPEAIIAAAVAAVRSCAWSPGAGPDGRPAPVWITATVTVGAR